MDQPQTQQGQPDPSQVEAEKQKLVEKVTCNLSRMHMFRKQYDQKRAYLYRQYLSQRDQQTFPDNVTKRANTFVPYPQQNVETVVSRVDDAFFSNYPFYEVRGQGDNDEYTSDKMQLVMDYELHKSKLKQAIESVVRTICIYGFGGLKVDWDWDYDVVSGPEPIFAQQPAFHVDPDGTPLPGPDGQPIPLVNQQGQPVMIDMVDGMGQKIQTGVRMVTNKVPKCRPKFIPIDVYDLLIDPDGDMVAHMTERTLPQLKREMEINPQLYYPDAIAELEAQIAKEKNPDEILIRMAEFWSGIDGTCTVITYAKDQEAISWKDLRASFRYTSYSGFKRRVYGGKPIVLWSGENQFAHKRCPILYTSYIKLPNEIYGLGIVETISDLSEALNQMVNMVRDNWNLGINKRYAYDVNADIDHSALNSFNVPGGKVGVNGPPNEVLFPLPTMTPNAGDYEILDLYKGMIEATSGVSDFYSKGVGSSGGNRTATGINQVIGESNFRFRMFIRNLELDIIQPLLEMVASMIQQFSTDEVEYMITDAPPEIPKWGKVKLEDLLGNYDFILSAANYASNKNIRQQQMMQFAQTVAESGYLLERPGLIELAKVFEIPHPQRFVKTEQQVQQEQMAESQARVRERDEQWAHDAQMVILQAMCNVEAKSRIEQSKPRPAGPGQGAGGGRPRTTGNSHTKGAGLETAIKSFAQSMGVRGMSLQDDGENG